jgi:hypothetical protein
MGRDRAGAGGVTEAPGREVIFEITRLGDVQRVAAIDIATGTEVVIQAPGNAALVDVRALALRKLQRALEAAPPPPHRPGKLI